MSLDDYFMKMPHTKSKKKTALAVHTSDNVEPVATEPEEANASEEEAAARPRKLEVRLIRVFFWLWVR